MAARLHLVVGEAAAQFWRAPHGSQRVRQIVQRLAAVVALQVLRPFWRLRLRRRGLSSGRAAPLKSPWWRSPSTPPVALRCRLRRIQSATSPLGGSPGSMTTRTRAAIPAKCFATSLAWSWPGSTGRPSGMPAERAVGCLGLPVVLGQDHHVSAGKVPVVIRAPLAGAARRACCGQADRETRAFTPFSPSAM